MGMLNNPTHVTDSRRRGTESSAHVKNNHRGIIMRVIVIVATLILVLGCSNIEPNTVVPSKKNDAAELCQKELRSSGVDPSSKSITFKKNLLIADICTLVGEREENVDSANYKNGHRYSVCIYAPRESSLGGTGYIVVNEDKSIVVFKKLGR